MENVKKAIPLVFLLLLSLIPLSATAQVETKEEWILETRGENYDIYSNSASPNLKRWVSANQRVQDSNGDWVDYVYRVDKAKGCYTVQSGLVAAEIYDYYAKIFSPDLSEARVYDERWEVQQLTKSGKWSDIGAQSGSPEYAVVPFSDGINITKSFHSWAGWLNITYTFRGSLKHTVMFASEIAEKTVFGVVQKWAGITGTKVKDVEADKSVPISESTKLNGTSFLFQKENEELSVYESQWSARDSLSSVTVDSHAEGMKCDFVFGNWTLAKGESLVIDPDTATLDSPTQDGYIAKTKYADYYYPYPDGNEIHMSNWFLYYWYASRGYDEWDISGIPDSVTITSVAFKYHGKARGSGDCHIHSMEYRPSTSGLPTIFIDMADGHVYADPTGFPVIGENQQVALSSQADADLQSSLASNWFAIGIQADDENTNHPTATSIYSSEYGSANPTPTLYVEYEFPPTYSDLSHSTTEANTDCQFNATVDDDVALHPTGQHQLETNITGSWVWSDPVNFVSTPETVSVTKTLPPTVGQVVGYRWKFTDNVGGTNTTAIQTLTTTDSTPPTFSTITANTTVANTPVQLTTSIFDNVEASHLIWSWNNTGTWANGTTTAFSSNPVTFEDTWNDTVGNDVCVKVYANDTLDNWGVSTQYNFTLTNYHAHFTYLPASPIQGDNVDITLHIQKAGETFSNYVANITRNGVLWKQNITSTNSTMTDFSLEATTRTYNVSALYDTDLSDFVDYSVTSATITWTAIGSTPPSGGSTTPTGYAVSIRVVKATAPVPSATVILADTPKTTDTQGYATFSVQAGTHTLKVIQDGNTVYSNQLQVTEDGVWQVDLNMPDQPPQNITPEKQTILPEIPSEIAQLGIVIIIAVILTAFFVKQSGKKSTPESEWRNKGKNIKQGEKWRK